MDLVKKLKTEHVDNLSSQDGCRIGNWVTTATRHRRHNSARLNMFSIQFFYRCEMRKYIGSHRELAANSIHSAQRDSTRHPSQQLRLLCNKTVYQNKKHLPAFRVIITWYNSPHIITTIDYEMPVIDNCMHLCINQPPVLSATVHHKGSSPKSITEDLHGKIFNMLKYLKLSQVKSSQVASSIIIYYNSNNILSK